VQGVRIKGMYSKESVFQKLVAIPVSGLCHRKGKLWKFFFYARPMRMRQLVTFRELGNNVDSTRTGSGRVVASGVEISHGCIASF
jgi:hypothetical protein